jgi:Asp-tRNA(Asn)/Glu-tRNA(Gln) amidotransferase A subunit family amidase
MNTTTTPGEIIDRLRANLRAAGIPATDADIEGMAAKGFLDRVVAFEQAAGRIEADLVPDYLAAWSDLTPSLSGAEREPRAPTPAARMAREDTDPHPSPLALGEGIEPAPPHESRLTPHASRLTPHGPRLTETAARVRARDVSPVELTEQALERIDAQNPTLNAFQLVLRDQALAAAREADREIAAGEYRGPLHGVPVAVKDLLALAGTPTTAGSRILADWAPDVDAAGVERLRAAGAIIVGKTRMSEFAYSPGSNNAHYGPTRNPWNLEHDTGGSSSGSGAAVAAGLVFAALGSDTGGSIRIPGALCGIVGLKPTFGRVSLFGAVTLSWSLDHLGPMTRSVADAAIMLDALSGADPRDPRTRPGPSPLPEHQEAGVSGLRIGVLSEDGSGAPLASDEVLGAWRSGLAALEAAGAELVELDLPEMQALRALYGVILTLEAIAYHEPFLRGRLDDYGEFPRQRLLASYAYGPNAFVRAEQGRLAVRRRFDRIFEQVDLLSTPTMPAGAPPLGVPAPTTFTGPFNALGWPAITVPCGLTAAGLPIGLQLAGRPWDEATVLRAARVLET